MYEPEETTQHHTEQRLWLPARENETGTLRGYVRFAALGDSATYGVGDPVGKGWRGWARILAESVGESHDISFCNLSGPGATTTDVCETQLADAVAHRPHLASLIVGLNDTMRSGWDPGQVRDNLFRCAEELTSAGAFLMTVRFHDHSQVFPLPKVFARPMSRRIETVNEITDDLHAAYGSLRVDLSASPEVFCRDFWSVDRLHPSELGYRLLAQTFADLLNDAGLPFPVPHLTCTSTPTTRRDDLRWLVKEGAPWVGRRARELGPAAARALVNNARVRFV